MRAGLRFFWLAGRGHRLRPWRSPYWRWRIETFSGAEAEHIGAGGFWGFAWRERASLARFLRWSGQMSALRRRSGRQSGQAGPAE
ncbi:MAG: hypothetical protein ACRD1E_07970 [Terriglobales bacterium]